jgi:hypothetical protein
VSGAAGSADGTVIAPWVFRKLHTNHPHVDERRADLDVAGIGADGTP